MADETFPLGTILPAQFFTPQPMLPESERRLRLAVLEDALRYYLAYAGRTARRARLLHEDAAEWLASTDRSEAFAFENVCDALGIDPGAIRRRLRHRDAEATRRFAA